VNVPVSRLEEGKRFLLEAARRDSPAEWAGVSRAAKEAGHKKTTIYDAVDELQDKGRIVWDGGYLWIPEAGAEDGWLAIVRVLDRWPIMSSEGLEREDRIACASSLARLVTNAPRIPCSRGLLRRFRRDLPQLPRPVFVAMIPFIQHLYRSAIDQAQNPPKLDAQGRWTEETLTELEEAILAALRKVIRAPPTGLDEVTLCGNLLFELVSRNRLGQDDVRRVAYWTLDVLVSSRSLEDYLERWEAVRALLRECGRGPEVRRAIQIRLLHGFGRANLERPWLSDLTRRFFGLAL